MRFSRANFAPSDVVSTVFTPGSMPTSLGGAGGSIATASGTSQVRLRYHLPRASSANDPGLDFSSWKKLAMLPESHLETIVGDVVPTIFHRLAVKRDPPKIFAT